MPGMTTPEFYMPGVTQRMVPRLYSAGCYIAPPHSLQRRHESYPNMLNDIFSQVILPKKSLSAILLTISMILHRQCPIRGILRSQLLRYYQIALRIKSKPHLTRNQKQILLMWHLDMPDRRHSRLLTFTWCLSSRYGIKSFQNNAHTMKIV